MSKEKFSQTNKGGLALSILSLAMLNSGCKPKTTTEILTDDSPMPESRHLCGSPEAEAVTDKAIAAITARQDLCNALGKNDRQAFHRAMTLCARESGDAANDPCALQVMARCPELNPCSMEADTRDRRKKFNRRTGACE